MNDPSNLPKMPPRAGRTSSFRPVPSSATFATSSSTPIQIYTVDSAIDHVGLGTFQYIVLLLAGFGWTAESMEMLLLSFIKQPLQCEWGISDSQAALITTFVAAGMLAGSTVWGVVADKIGRRNSFIISTVFLFIMGLLSAVAVNYTMMLFARGLVGFGVGGIPVAFSLLMEFLPNAQRGSWGMSLALFWALGAVFESAVAMYILPKFGWRWLIVFSTLPIFLVIVFSFWLSESPRWLAAKGKYEKAQTVLERIARVNRGVLPPGRLDTSGKSDLDLDGVDSNNNDDIEVATSSALGQQQQYSTVVNNDNVDDPFTSRDALISAQVSPVNNADYTASTDIASDAAAPVPSPVTQNGSDDAEDTPLDEGWSESSPRSSKKSGLADLLRPGARGLAFQIGVAWFACAFVYYGLVMLQPEVISAENAGHRCGYAAAECAREISPDACDTQAICSWVTKKSDKTPGAQCIPSGLLETTSRVFRQDSLKDTGVCARKLTRDDFISTFWASVGEMPGVLIAFVIVDVVGRRPVLGYFFGSLCVSFVLLIWCTSRFFETATFFIARGAGSGVYQATYLYTNEVYPSSIRASAMGIASSISRVGLLVTPFVAQYLFNISELSALLVYAASAFISFFAIVALPIETTGRPLVASMQELVQTLREARLRGNDVGTSFSSDPSVSKFVRFFRWRATLDGVTVK